MYSYSTIDCNALQKLISEKVGFTVKARYRNILGSAETNKGNKVFAIHLEINASINQIHRVRLRNLFPKLQGNSSDYERAFQPTNQPMMLIPTYANNKSPEVAHQCRKRQEHFLSQIKVVPLENTFQRMVSHYICGTNFSLKDLVESVDIPGTSERLVLSIDQKPFQDYPRLTYHKKLEREVTHFLDGFFITLLNYARSELTLDPSDFNEGRFKTYFYDHVVQASTGCKWNINKMTHISPVDSLTAELSEVVFLPDKYGHGVENLEEAGLDPNWKSKHGFLNADESTVGGLTDAAMTIKTYKSNSSKATALRNMPHAHSSGFVGQEDMEQETLDGDNPPSGVDDDDPVAPDKHQLRPSTPSQSPQSLFYGTPNQHNPDSQLDNLAQSNNFSSPLRNQLQQAAGPSASSGITDPRGAGQHP